MNRGGEILVSQWSITFMIGSVILSVLVPIISLIYFYKKRKTSWNPVLIGVLIFIVFSQLIGKLVNTYVLVINQQTRDFLQNTYLYALYGGLSAAFFEEIGRFLGFYYFLRKYREWKDAIAYGLGHGGIEAVLIGGMSGIQNISMSFMINSGRFEQLLKMDEVVLCQENGHVKQREIAELRQLLFSD
jgi:uncharacterized membrane protein YhfC